MRRAWGVDLASIGSATVCNFIAGAVSGPNDLYGFRNNRQVLCVGCKGIPQRLRNPMTVGDGFFLIGAVALAYIVVRGLWRPPRVKHWSDQQSGSSDINSPIGF